MPKSGKFAPGVLVLRTVILILTIVSFVFGILSMNSTVFFRISPEREEEFKKIVALYTRNQSNDTVASEMFLALTHPTSGSTITMWNVELHFESITIDEATKTITVTNSNASVMELSNDYITCDDGKMYIQVAQGLGIVSCVFSGATILFSIYLFFYAVMVKFPLILYSFLSSAFVAVASGIVFYFYYSGFCDQTPLHNDEWLISIGFMEFLVLCALQFIVCFITIFATAT